MRVITLKNFSSRDIEELIRRPQIEDEQVFARTRLIIDEVKSRGDKALFEFTERYDAVKLSTLRVSTATMNRAEKKVASKVAQAFRQASANIEKFHRSQLNREKPMETMPGVRCFRASRAIERVGLYIPGGTAILPSTVLMLAIPAKLAGCKNIILCTPPRDDGSVAPEILLAARIAGVSAVYRVGGAQAIAALAYGTASIPKVDKIFGPGNQYVTAAKMIVSTSLAAQVTIDMPAGPSEVLVMTDETANPEFVAADLLSQAEHGVDSQVVVVCTVRSLLKKIELEIERQLSVLPRRAIAEKVLEKSLMVIVGSLQQAFEFSNSYAPEHLILQIKNPTKYLDLIQNAGSVFIGPWSPESVGDYASGTNHTLPTYGYARNSSGVSVESFLKKITFQELTRGGLKKIGPTVEVLAECEGLQAHKNAVTLRLNSLL